MRDIQIDAALVQIDKVVAQAVAAAPEWAASEEIRARLLRALADALESQSGDLVSIADRETGLGQARLQGEVARTAFQLRGFADEVTSGLPFAGIEDQAVAGAPPAGRPRLTRIQVPLGPVAMFSASNFPFAFSVLGGDTASALAAGCPVVVKAHSGHPALSRAVFEMARNVIATERLPQGVLGLVESTTREAGRYLVQHPGIAAVAFTGSFQGGVALWKAANERLRPIPFYGELGSINPVVAMPEILERDGEALANALAASIALGCGQFCTSPGVIMVFDGGGGDRFVARLAAQLQSASTHRMLTDSIRAGYEEGVARLSVQPGVRELVAAQKDTVGPAPRLFEVDAERFINDVQLREEIFGPAAVILRVKSAAQAVAALEAIGGTLTATLWGLEHDSDDNRALVRAAERIAGRVLFSGVPTGVAITRAQQHGGPWPASTQPQSTSVGYAALQRFLRPVALQDAPNWLAGEPGALR